MIPATWALLARRNPWRKGTILSFGCSLGLVPRWLSQIGNQQPVEEPPVEHEVIAENCSGIVSSLKIVPHLSVQSKASMIVGCTGGDVHDLATGQDNTLLLMDIRSEQNERQAEEFRWQLLYPFLIFTFDPGELTYPSTLPSMPSNSGGGTAAHGGLDLQGEQVGGQTHWN